MALGRQDELVEEPESYIEKIKNARPLEFESVLEDYEAENDSSCEEQMDLDQKKESDNFEELKSKINEKMLEEQMDFDLKKEPDNFEALKSKINEKMKELKSQDS